MYGVARAPRIASATLLVLSLTYFPIFAQHVDRGGDDVLCGVGGQGAGI